MGEGATFYILIPFSSTGAWADNPADAVPRPWWGLAARTPSASSVHSTGRDESEARGRSDRNRRPLQRRRFA